MRPDIFTTLERVRETEPNWANLGDLIAAVAFVCSQVRGTELVQDLLDEACMVMDNAEVVA